MSPPSRARRAALIAGSTIWFLTFLGAISPFHPAKASAGCRYRYAKPTKVSTKEVKRATMCLINEERSRHGAPRVDPNGRIGDAGRRHSRYMQAHHCFSHQCRGEPGLLRRIARSGYFAGARSYGCGEAIGWGDMTPKRMVKRWMASGAHRAILLDPDFEHVGVGTVWGTPWKAKANAAIYTADFCYRDG